MARLDPEEGFEILKNKVSESVGNFFPIEGSQHTLRLKNLVIEDNKDIEDVRSQKNAKLNDRTWAVPVNAELELIDNKTGKVIDTHTQRIMNLPKITNRYSYIVDGHEYQLDNQWRLRPGPYSRVNQKGEFETMFNLKGRSKFDVSFDPKTFKFIMKKENANIPLYPILKEMGVPDEDLEKAWGKQVFHANKIADSGKALTQFYQATKKTKPTDIRSAKDFLHEFMDGAEMDPEVCKLTLGNNYDTVNGSAIRDASKKLLKISRGEQKVDARDSLMFKTLHSAEDFIGEAIEQRSKEITRRIGNNLNRKDKIQDIISSDIFNRPVKQLFTKTSLSNSPDQINPLEMLSGGVKTTIMGEGGIKSEHKITQEAKLIDASHLGYLDPIFTPESSRTGVTLHLPLGATKKGNTVVAKLWNVKTEKMEDVDPTKAYHSNIILPDQVKWKDGKPTPINKKIKMSGPENEVIEGDIKQADYIMTAPAQLYSAASNLIPFIQNTSANRSTMAGRHMEQAIPLKYREEPLVQSVIRNGRPETSLNEFVGQISSQRASINGRITKVKNDVIIIKGVDGKNHEVQIYDHFPLNDDKSFIHSTPLVKVGDEVKEGQVLADTNFTKNGKLSLGINLRAAYMPYYGYNFEDGIGISESAAKKLTSEHMYRKGIDIDPNHLLDKKKFIAYYPNALTKEQAEKLDDDGVAKPGQIIKPGDTLVAAMRKREETDEARILATMHKSLVKPYVDNSVRWEGDHPGVVTNVVKRGKRTEVHVRTDEPAEIGDKLCFDLNTEVLTKKGWKFVKEITLDDECYTLNNKIIELHKPESIHNYPISGEMYELRSQQVDLNVTSNHKLYVRKEKGREFKLIEARNVFGKKVYYKKNGTWTTKSPDKFHLPASDLEIPIKSWAAFLGIYLADGDFSIDDNKTIIHFNNDTTLQKTKYILDECGFIYYLTPSVAIIDSIQLTNYVSQFGLINERFIPQECFSWGIDAIECLLDGFYSLHHYYNHNNKWHYKYQVVSPKLADGIQILVFHKGIAANIKRKKYPSALLTTRYDVDTITQDELCVYNEQSERFYISNEPVVGITVKNGILYIRKNGKTVWTGNSGRFGDKGIVTRIIPDHEMPYTKDGKPTEILLNPAGVPGRLNLGQVLETAAGKISEKTGKLYITQNFDGTSDVTEKVRKDLAEHSLTDKEEVIDPKTGKVMGNVLTGPHYIHKLKHQVGKKLVARAGGPGYAYDMNRIPKGGGPHGAQALDALGLYAMLNHGAMANIREMQTYKSDAADNDQLWSAIQSGDPIPTPRPTFAYNKFVGMLKAAGVNTVKQGNTLTLTPLTDKQVKEMSNGELTDAGRMVKGKTLDEEKNGLFDKKITGGTDGKKWAHITLPEPMPNPIFEKSIIALTGLTQKQFDDLMLGKQASLDSSTGKIINDPTKGISSGKAIQHLLGKINVEKDLATAQEQLKNLKGNKLDQVNRKIKYLKSLQNLGMSPTEAYMQKHVAVMPPAMRPISFLPNGHIIHDDLNGMYKGLALSAQQLKDAPKALPDDMLNKERASVYDAMKSLAGLGGHLNREYRGVLDIIRGKTISPEGQKSGSPREGFFQSKLIKRKQDLSMRSTIIPEPELGLDQVAIPKKAAMEIYKPFVVRELRGLTGMSPLKAQQAIKSGDMLANRALERVIENRPVLLKRDPVLHKYGVQAFKPILTSGKAVKIHPLVTSGYNADFDGDHQLNTVLAFVSKKTYNAAISFWSIRRLAMSARFKETLGFWDSNKGEFCICNLEDFPREKLIRVKGHIEFWSVPEGIEVAAIDEKSGELVLAPVSHWSLHKKREVEIVELGSGRQIITDDDERAVYGIDASSLEWCRRRPKEAKNQFVPVSSELPICESAITSILLPEDPHNRLRKEAILNEDFGYFLGTMIGDGWVAFEDRKHNNQKRAASINLASEYASVYNAWEDSLLSVFHELPVINHETTYEGKLGDHENGSTRHTVTCAAIARFLIDMMGISAENKHLPPFFFAAPHKFLLGLLAGLWDTDGSMSWSGAKDKRQFMCSYTSSSIRLVQEIQQLLFMMGVSSTITLTNTPKGEDFWALNVSIVEFYRFGGIPVHHEWKAACQKEFMSGACPNTSMAYSRYRLMPIPSALAKELRDIFGSKDRSLYVTLSKAIDRQYISKEMSKNIIKKVQHKCSHPLYLKWRKLVLMEGVHFERVVKISCTKIVEDGYDLTVPGYETFMSIDGVILSNTMSAFVPISSEAVAEAKKMFPSNNLFNPATGDIMYTPTHESRLGIYMLNQEGKKTNKSFENISAAAKAAETGQIQMTDVVNIGPTRTTVGRALIANALPASMRQDVLKGKINLDGKGQSQLLTEIAKNYKNDYGEVSNKLKDLGNKYSTTSAISIGLDDIKADTQNRDRILRIADAKVAEIMKGSGKKQDKEKKAVQIYDAASEAMVKTIKEKHIKNPTTLVHMMLAGVKPQMGAYRQITMAPMLMMNAKGEVIPSPIRKSYSEGLDVGDYWTQMSGARKGVVQKVQSVQEPGYLTKQLMNSVMNNSITSPDCGTTKGISLPVTERDILDRYLAVDTKAGKHVFKAGTLITPGVRDSLRNNKVGRIVVRSPLRCEHGIGICAKCHGLDENGENAPIGKNVGIISAQAVGERATQLSMRTFHEGGVAPVGEAAKRKSLLTDEFNRVQQLVQMNAVVPNSAPLSSVSGKINKITKNPAGGMDVYVGDTKHYVPQNRGEPLTIVNGKPIKLKIGVEIQKGSPLSAGPINPHEMLPLTGINKVQSHVAGELYNLYKGEGIRRRNIETLVKSMTNLTKIKDSGDHPEYIRGDFAPTSYVQALNKKLAAEGKQPIKHSPVLKGVKTLPLDVQTDWLARLNHERQNETIIDAANQGWSSDIHNRHPIPALVYGAEFGKGKPPKY